MFDKFQEIEKNYDVEDVHHKGEQVWAYLRDTYFQSTIKDVTNEYSTSKKKNSLARAYKMIRQLFYGYKNWFRHYDNMFFGYATDRALEHGSYMDMSLDKIIETYGHETCLMIETPDTEHKPIEKVQTKYIVSSVGLKALIIVLSKFASLVLSKRFILNTLEQINRDNNFDINYQKIIVEFNIRKKLYKLFFTIYRPQTIYIICYYGKQDIICAANELGIQTVEVQHGIIGKEHYAYNLHKKLKKKFFPNTLLVYGVYDKRLIKSNKLSPFSRVVPVGSYKIEQLTQKDVPKTLLKYTEQYEKTISISTQSTVENELAVFIKNIAEQYPQYGFLFALRHFDKEYYGKFNMPGNVHLFYQEYTCYDILKACDAHCTVYSTCAIESTSFKKKSIVVNFEKLPFVVFNKSENIIVVRNETDFIESLHGDYTEEENLFYTPNYAMNIRNFLLSC